ncbi:transmembrane gamma-carboxyglutamic acid protein 1 isoform X2 [Callorhinchus milii]|uniref:transmembrane gamma-carboxyglutamic acid protein 1 isoform X2 n=1 Tax=Callorhinchus milii TaxID=7868 RepID=UPI001C3FAA78|nr:transmembrane gamma-carboxyglutamic acid protein 1 isoform X2 [Callorhinchus milii]XP_007902247.2 transmembrane gamma-carboxyglutamic acid protein 1 isoform X2 [Callorhinchus milii]
MMQSVFLMQSEANAILKRYRRANNFFEEVKQGNIERECREEVCTYEEAREAFENDEATNAFWKDYMKGPDDYQGSGSDVNVDSVYIIVPLLTGLLMIIVILFVIWRCQLRKATLRQSVTQTRCQANQTSRNVSVVVFGYNEQHVGPFDPLHTQLLDGLTADYSSGNCLASGMVIHGPLCSSGLSNSGLPPSYDEATGQVGNVRNDCANHHGENPPKYEEIVNPNVAKNVVSEVERNVR